MRYEAGQCDIAVIGAGHAGIEAALDAGFEKVKLNTVLIGGFNDDEIPQLAGLTRKWPADLRFIELMPMVEGFGQEAFLPCSAVLAALPELTPAEADGGVARLWRLPDGKGRVGLISPIGAHFCAACSRLRLTADGMLKPCLHAGDEISVRGLDQAGMEEKFREAILRKPLWHGELGFREPSRAGRSMDRIGG